MEFIVRWAFIFCLFVVDTHQSAVIDGRPLHFFGADKCRVQYTTIGPTFKRAGHCKGLILTSVNFTEPSPALFDSLADGLNSLVIHQSTADTIYLPHNLTSFYFSGTNGFTTQVVIEDGDSSYKLENIFLTDLPELPANINNLQLLKVLKLSSVYGNNFDLNVLFNLTQLELISIFAITGVTITDVLQLPSLRHLQISDSPITFLHDSPCRFSNLESLQLHTNGLFALPEHFTEFTKLTEFSVRRNRLRNVTLDMFANMNRLRTLDLSDNQIAEVTTQHRLELPLMTRLCLSNNNLSELNATLWIMPALQFLSLQNNQLKQVPGLPMLFTGNVQQYTVDLIVNPWDCEWLQEMAALQIRIRKPIGCWKV